MDNFSLETPLNLAPSGIATFAKSDLCTDIRKVDADIGIVGAPFDIAIQGRTGCRMGPRGIRLGSTRFRFKKGGSYDYERDTYYMDSDLWHVVDCGDVDYVPGNGKKSDANLRSAVEILVERGVFPVVLGGDCSTDYPFFQGLAGKGAFDVIHLDSHLDWTKPLDGQLYFNGSPMRNAVKIPEVGRILHLGVRGAGSSGSSDFEDARENGDRIYSVRKFRELGIERILEEFQPQNQLAIAFDIDAMDPSIAPATGSPIFGGFYYDEVVDIFEAVVKESELIGMILTEVAPPYDDPAGTTGYLAARLIGDLLNFWSKKRELDGRKKKG